MSVLSELGVDRNKICIDLFACSADTQEQFFCTERNSAWQYDWSKFCPHDEILWANPPFEDMPKVLTKICLEPCRIVLVVPQWRDEVWTELLSKCKLKDVIYPPGFPFMRPPKAQAFWLDLIGGVRWFL